MKKKYLCFLPLLVAPFLMGCNQTQYYSITFDAGEGCFDYGSNNEHQTETIKVASGQIPKFSKIPEKVEGLITNKTRHYPFLYWLPEIVPATRDKTYTAKYDTNSDIYCTVTIHTFDETDTIIQEVKEGEKASKPTQPSISGGEFQFWTKQDPSSVDGEPTPFDFETTSIDTDCDIYAYYTGVDYNHIIFDASGGNFGTTPKKTQKIVYIGEKKYKDFKIPAPLLKNYDFRGYSFSEGGISTNLINPEQVFNENKTVYASYRFVYDGDITLVESSTIEFYYNDPRPVDDNLRVQLFIKQVYADHYALPEIEDVALGKRIKISNKKTGEIDYKKYTYWCNDIHTEGYIDIPKELAVGGLYITIGDSSPTYDADIFGGNIRLIQPEKARHGYDFSFIIDTSITEHPETHYRIPDALDIYIKGRAQKLPSDCYRMVLDEYSSHTRATVTILGQYVKGDLFIVGGGIPVENSCGLILDVFGLTSKPNDYLIKEEGKFEVILEPEFGANVNEDSEILPNAEDVWFKDDTTNEWHQATNNTYANYEVVGSTAKLKFNLSQLGSANTIHVITRAKNYPLLDYLTWEMIERISDDGLAPYFFFLGETKQIDVTYRDLPVKHKVQIIGFNHDQITGEEVDVKAGITFEFKDLISYSSTEGHIYGYDTSWEGAGPEDGNNRDFAKHSNLNRVLEKPEEGETGIHGELYRAMPQDLLKVVKTVEKPVGLYSESTSSWSVQTYDTNFFPLSAKEIDKNYPTERYLEEGELYEYYDVDDEEVADTRRMKCNVGESSAFPYWLRSPMIEDLVDAGGIEMTGKVSPGETPFQYAVAPAFCV